jgi:hypothetical protein
MAIIKHTASCTGAVSVRFYDQLGDILTDLSAPFEVHIGISGANTSGVTRTFKLSAEACSGDVPAQCVKMSDTVAQAPLGSIAPPSCSAKVSPASLPASGGSYTLSAACSGSPVGSWLWKVNETVIGDSSSVTRWLEQNTETSSRTKLFQLKACAAEDPSACSTSSATLTQAGATPPVPTPVAAPSCSAMASPSTLPTGGGIVTLTASCTAAVVGSWTWKQNGGVLGQSATLSVSVGANASTSSRVLTYQLTACAAEDGSKCGSAWASVLQSGAAAPPTPTPTPEPPPPVSCNGSAPVVTRAQACPAGYVGNILEQQVYACSNGQWVATATWQSVQNTCKPVDAPMAPVSAVEFYHAKFDHYFLSADAAEIGALDSGKFAGWTRTGYSFDVLPSVSAPLADSVPVCRYYGNPAEGLNTHFYSASAQECQFVGERWPTTWLLESGNVFQVVKVDAGSHLCPAGTTTVYRFFNNRKDVNHRYVVSEVIKAEMTARGWVPEGAAFCSSP